MANAFISYSSEDKTIVEHLVQDLDTGNLEIWFDERLSGSGGQRWWDKILDEIRDCDIFVAVLSPNSLDSEACKAELKYASELQKPLLPVRVSEKVQPKFLPLGLGERQLADYLRQDREEGWKLRRSVSDLPRAPPLPDPLPERPPVPGSYRELIELIETGSRLDEKDQSILVIKLRRLLRDGTPADEISELLQRLLKRRDLFHDVVRDIEELQNEVGRGQRFSPPNENDKLRPALSPLRALREQIETDSPLEVSEQYNLVFKLRYHFRQGDPSDEIIGLLQRLKRRNDTPAKVVNEIQKLEGEIKRMQPGTGSSREHAIVKDKPDGDRKDQVPATRHFGLDSSNVVSECRGLLERVLNKRECWIFEIDRDNSFAIELDALAADPTIIAKAALQDKSTQKKELKALGWTVDSSGQWIATALGGAALYLTTGLAAAALASRGVRKFFTGFEAYKAWIVSNSKDGITDAAADFTLALRRVAPEAKTVIVRRKEAEAAA
jgi:TIR domain